MVENNSNIEVIISRYLSRKATKEEFEILEAWIAADPANRQSYLTFKNLWETAHPAFPPGDINTVVAHDKIMKEIQHQSRTHKKRSFIHYWQRVAAILILPLIVGFTYLMLKPAPRINESFQTVFTPFGTRSVINLPDGSKVWLNAGSTLEYPVQFNGDERTVTIKGEAFFEVEADKAHPFIVQTGKLSVRATGTAFNVDAYSPDSLAAVTLIQGKVSVILNSKETILLTPGERIDYNQATARYNIQATDAYKWCSWKDGVLTFKDDPLEYVFKRLGQTYNIEFILKDTELGKHPYRATFEGESINEILRLIEMSTPIRYHEISDRRKNNVPLEKQRIEVYQIVE